MENPEEDFKSRWKKMLEGVRELLLSTGIASVSTYNVECDDGSCVYDYCDIFAFRTYRDALEYLKICMVELDVVDYNIYYDSGIDAWILEVVYHSHKH